MPDEPTTAPAWQETLKASAAFKDLTEDAGAEAKFADTYIEFNDLGPAHLRRLYGFMTAVLPTYRVARGGISRSGKSRIRVT